MPRTPDYIGVYLLLEGGHREQVRFPSIQDFQKWYQGVLVPNSEGKEFINVPIKTSQGEYMVVRPVSILGIRVEPIFLSSVDRSFAEE
ncbi:hypothetical protein [Phormidium sp. CCY1219]|jgi:hypothetical protein|uniref:hypothetical protein n=1 Tax=Phormidium sp. CCY1219 TaxID=2886104 RepID=UPI002D1F46E0|nr:hypothetical protein [Phormidium sp. CCY1219]MEB3831577.1 hypothetical protein [Phormidium sp. CCY1219]